MCTKKEWKITFETCFLNAVCNVYISFFIPFAKIVRYETKLKNQGECEL